MPFSEALLVSLVFIASLSLGAAFVSAIRRK